MAIGAIIGLISTVFQAVRAFSPPEAPQAAQPGQKADKLFAELDALGRGEIQSADLVRAFDRIGDQATAGAEKLFGKLDADGSGTINRREFTGSINRLADQLDTHFMRVRLHGEGDPAPADGAGFSREELTGQLSGIVGNFDRADANGDGRVSLAEAKALANAGAAGVLPSAAADNVETMLKVVRLMQAYGIVGGSTDTADTAGNGAARKVSDQA